MSLFRPKCPLCECRGHSSAAYHEQRFEELVQEITTLQAKLKDAEQDQFDEITAGVYQDMLQTAIDEIYVEAKLLCQAHRVPELIRAHSS